MWISRIVAATARTAKTDATQQHTSSHNEWATELVTRCMLALRAVHTLFCQISIAIIEKKMKIFNIIETTTL